VRNLLRGWRGFKGFIFGGVAAKLEVKTCINWLDLKVEFWLQLFFGLKNENSFFI